MTRPPPSRGECFPERHAAHVDSGKSEGSQEPAYLFPPKLSCVRGAQETNMALHFELVTPAKLVRSADVHMVVVPASEGDFRMLEAHAPFRSKIGRALVRTPVTTPHHVCRIQHE